MMCAGCLSGGEALVISACGVLGFARAKATRRVQRRAEEDRAGPESEGREHWAHYGLALVLYVAAALLTLRWRDNVVLLNWIVGPLFPVAVLFAIPAAARRVRRRWR